MKIIAKHQLISQKYLLVDYRCQKRHLGSSRYMRVAGLSSVKSVVFVPFVVNPESKDKLYNQSCCSC